MVPSPVSVLIAAASGPLREALQALILSLGGVRSLSVFDDPAGLPEALPAALAEGGVLVLLVPRSGQAWQADAAALRHAAPRARIAVLADEIAAHGLGGIPADLVVDLVIQQGAPPEALVAGIEKLLGDLGEEGAA